MCKGGALAHSPPPITCFWAELRPHETMHWEGSSLKHLPLESPEFPKSLGPYQSLNGPQDKTSKMEVTNSEAGI